MFVIKTDAGGLYGVTVIYPENDNGACKNDIAQYFAEQVGAEIKRCSPGLVLSGTDRSANRRRWIHLAEVIRPNEFCNCELSHRQ